MKLVLDASVTLNWLNLPSQPYRGTAFRILEGIDDYITCVPTIWSLEVAHGAMRAERSGLASANALAKFSEILTSIPVVEEQRPTPLWLAGSVSLARKHGLTVYDASYLELALATNAILATFDQRLQLAANACGIPVLGPPPRLAEPQARYGSTHAHGARHSIGATQWRTRPYFTPYFVRYASTASRFSANEASSCSKARMSVSDAIATTGMP